MRIKLSHILIAVLSATVWTLGTALAQLSAGAFDHPATYLISILVGLGNAVGVAVVTTMVNDDWAFTLARPGTPPSASPKA